MVLVETHVLGTDDSWVRFPVVARDYREESTAARRYPTRADHRSEGQPPAGEGGPSEVRIG